MIYCNKTRKSVFVNLKMWHGCCVSMNVILTNGMLPFQLDIYSHRKTLARRCELRI